MPTRSIADLLRDRVLDAELASLAWLLLEARLPVVVAGPEGSGRATLVGALLDFLPPDARLIQLAGPAEEFEWLPGASNLGWLSERPAALATDPVDAGVGVMVVGELGGHGPAATSGPRARVALRALAQGYGMAATMRGERLEDVLDTLRATPVSAGEDELSRLGLVLLLGTPAADPPDARPRRRVVAAHYLRPVARDAHGHVQRMPPAVLAAYDARSDRWDHFAWGLLAELAARTGRRPAAFEREQARRAASLAELAAAPTDPAALRAALARQRASDDEAITSAR